MVNNRLEPGDQAPKFKVADIWGKEVGVSEKGKWTYLTFHRYASCPFCVLRTRELMRAYPQFEQNNIEILSIWPSNQENMLKYVGNEKPPFPLIADRMRQLYVKYGVVEKSALSMFRLLAHPKLVFNAIRGKLKKIEIDADPIQLPADFLIAPTGEVMLANYGKHFGDHMDIQNILSKALTLT